MASLFNHLVGQSEQDRRDGDLQRSRSLEIDDEIELGWLLDGKVSRFRAAKNLVDIVAAAPGSSPLCHLAHDFERPQLSYASGSASGDVSGNSLISRTSTFSPGRYR